VIKSRRLERAGRAALMGEGRKVYRIWWGNLRKRDDLEHPGVEGRIIIIRWIFNFLLHSYVCLFAPIVIVS